MDFIPEAHTLLIVVASVDSKHPAPNAACLAGACPFYNQDQKYKIKSIKPTPALTTFPSISILINRNENEYP